MRITIDGSAIVCSRLDNTLEEDGIYRQVVEFDARVDSVPPSVAARLTSGEVLQLEEFLAERRRTPDNTAEMELLETLPGTLRDAIAVVNSVHEIDEAAYEELSRTLADLVIALENAKPGSKDN